MYFTSKVDKQKNHLSDKEKVVVVSLRSPYDNMHLNGLENYICLYEVTKWSLMSLAKCLQGKVEFQGKLPIKLVR